jgi:hypothetical protein
MGRASEQSGQARLLFSYKTDLRYSDVDFREYKSFKRIVNMAKYIISIDQSTQGTKALLFDETGSAVPTALTGRSSMKRAGFPMIQRKFTAMFWRL